MRTHFGLPVIALSAAALTLAVSSCSSSDSAGGGDFPTDSIAFMVPSGAGGGWDTTARAMAEVIETEDLTTESVQVSNVEGGGGATGLAQLQSSEGDPNAWMMTGLVMYGALQQADSSVTLEDSTPPLRRRSSRASLPSVELVGLTRGRVRRTR